MLVELRNTVFVNSTNIATNIETAAPLNSNNDNVEQKCSKFEVEGIIVVECRKYCSSARILPAVSESQGCGKMFEENAFFSPSVRRYSPSMGKYLPRIRPIDCKPGILDFC